MAHEGWKGLEGFSHSVTEIISIAGTQTFVVASQSNLMRVYRDTGEMLMETRMDEGASIHAIAVSPDNQWIAVGLSPDSSPWWLGSSIVRFVRLPPQRPLSGSKSPPPLEPIQGIDSERTIWGFFSTIESLAFSSDGTRIAVGTRYNPVQVISLCEPSSVEIVDSERRNEDLFFTDDDLLLHSPRAGELILEDPSKKRPSQKIGFVGNIGVRRLCRSPDKQWFAAVAMNNCQASLIHHRDNGAVRYTLECEPVEIRSLRFSDDGKFVIAGTLGGAVVVWDMSSLGPKSDPKLPIRRPSTACCTMLR